MSDSALNILPSEVINLIVSWLDGCEVQRLWTCGNSLLQYRLTNVESLTFLFDPVGHLARWPSYMLQRLPRLRSLSVGYEKGLRSLPFVGLDLSVVPKCLESLSFDAMGERVNSPFHASLDEMFPCMTYLVIRNSICLQHVETMLPFPSQLRHLELHGRDLCASTSIWNSLPSSLDTFILNAKTPTPENIPAWPDLQTLSLKLIVRSPDVLEKLPASLRGLSLHLFKPDSRPHHFPFCWKSLPRNISSLKLFYPDDLFDSCPLGSDLPPSVTRLTLMAVGITCSSTPPEEIWQHLPGLIEYNNLPVLWNPSKLNNSNYTRFPCHLTNATLDTSSCAIPASFFSSIGAAITSLRGVRCLSFPALPPYLTELSYDDPRPNDKVLDFALPPLPDTIRTLRLAPHRIPAEQARTFFPKHLTHLECTTSNLPASHFMCCLPQTVRFLKIVSMNHNRCDSVLEHAETASHLPPLVCQLIIVATRFTRGLSEWISHIPHHIPLKRMTVSDTIKTWDDPSRVEPGWWPRWPKTLRSLHLPALQFVPPELAKLPSRLRKLDLFFLDASSASLTTDELCQLLPKGLHYLNLTVFGQPFTSCSVFRHLKMTDPTLFPFLSLVKVMRSPFDFDDDMDDDFDEDRPTEGEEMPCTINFYEYEDAGPFSEDPYNGDR